MSTPAGYLGTPLATKLGVKAAMAVVLLGEPAGFRDTVLGALPDAVTLTTRLRGKRELVVCFVTARAALARRLPALRAAIEPAGMVWIAWPKRASGVATDITEDVIRAVVLPTELVDPTTAQGAAVPEVCAIDATWSGLKLVVRKELR